MAFMHGKNAKFYFRTGATMRDLSPYLTKAGIARKADVAEVSPLGTNDKQFLNGMREGTMAIDGYYDPTVDSWLAPEFGGTAEAFKYFPQGSASGKRYYSGSAILTTYNVDTDTGDAGKITGEFQFTGAITPNTVA